MSDTTDLTSTPDTGGASVDAPRTVKRGALGSLLLPELKQIAGGLGIRTTGLRKSDLVEAIRAAQSGGAATRSGGVEPGAAPSSAPAAPSAAALEGDQSAGEQPSGPTGRPVRSSGRRGRVVREAGAPAPAGQDTAAPETAASDAAAPAGDTDRLDAAQSTLGQGAGTGTGTDAGTGTGTGTDADTGTGTGTGTGTDEQVGRSADRGRGQGGRTENRADRGDGQDDRANQNERGNAQPDRASRKDTQNNQGSHHSQGSQNNQGDRGNGQPDRVSNQNDRGDDAAGNEDEAGGRRNRRRRGRDRDRTTGPAPGGNPGNQGNPGSQGNQERASGAGGSSGGGHGGGTQRGNRGEPDLNVLEDDVLTPCAGILDVLDNYAFVRTSGYLPGNDDVYVSLSMVRKFGLRRGDAVTGQVRQPREGERKEKFNPLVSLDTVNGSEPDAVRDRVEFEKLTPVHPAERLRLETTTTELVGRVIDVVAPLGKGQRGLVLSPAAAGKTNVLASVARAITTNNPEVHLMVVLVDERPEEVTDFERSVRGEVVASTFDRPAADHITVAELAIERAKRLVELGHDVVVLLDGITPLARAYNIASPASGRVLAGGVDSSALYPPKRFFGSARNVEDGGSLTILATALVETGSRTDEVILEEFAGTANMELRLRRDLADRRAFPAVDAVASGTHHEDLLMAPEEVAIVSALRRRLAGLGVAEAQRVLVGGLESSRTNLEFLRQVQRGSHD